MPCAQSLLQDTGLLQEDLSHVADRVGLPHQAQNWVRGWISLSGAAFFLKCSQTKPLTALQIGVQTWQERLRAHPPALLRSCLKIAL